MAIISAVVFVIISAMNFVDFATELGHLRCGCHLRFLARLESSSLNGHLNQRANDQTETREGGQVTFGVADEGQGLDASNTVASEKN